MICLDCNILIGGVIQERPESRHLLAWFAAGETFCTAAPAWYEFICGPVETSHVNTMLAFLSEGIIAFEESRARTAARLFNAVKRSRRSRVDAVIAATAISRQARLATLNTEDFALFEPHGLELATLPQFLMDKTTASALCATPSRRHSTRTATLSTNSAMVLIKPRLGQCGCPTSTDARSEPLAASGGAQRSLMQ